MRQNGMNLRGEHPAKPEKHPELVLQDRKTGRSGEVGSTVLYKTKVTNSVQGFAARAFLENGNHQTTQIRVLHAGHLGSVAAVQLLLLGTGQNAQSGNGHAPVPYSPSR